MESKREMIVQDLLSALETMSVGVGYNYDWHAFYRSVQTKEVSGYPSALIDDGAEEVSPLAYPLFDRSLSVEIQAVHKVHGGIKDEPGTAATRLISDIEAAVMQDTTRGGFAIDCLVVGNDRIVDMDPYVFVFVRLVINYRTRLTDPTQGQ